jgi:PAS domain S-box-containing protein
MNIEPASSYLRDKRLAELAVSPKPAWLLSTSGTQVQWANPVGAAAFGGQSADGAPRVPSSLSTQILRFAATLPQQGGARLARLHGLGAGIGRALLCECSRRVLPDGQAGFLIVALDPAGPPLSLAERARRICAVFGHASVVLLTDGRPIHTSAAARAVLGETWTLASIGAETLAREAIVLGEAVGSTPNGPISILRLGRDQTAVLMLTLLMVSASTPLAVAPVAAEPVAAAPVAPDPITPGPDVAEPDLTGPDEIDALAVEPAAIEQPVEPPAPEPSHAEPPVTPLEIPSPWITEGIPAPKFEFKPAVAPKFEPRRHPLRFVWEIDADGRFTSESQEFAELIGPRVATALGERWDDLARILALDSDEITRAIASRDTWSGIVVSWPVDGADDRVDFEMSGLPIYDRDRAFLGYRGFGVCRDLERLDVIERQRYGDDSASRREAESRPPLALVSGAKNVVPFRTGGPADTRMTSPAEHNAFNELARQLAARLQSSDGLGSLSPALQAASTVGNRPIAEEPADRIGATARGLLERLPIGVLVYRLDRLLYANRAFLDTAGHPSLDALTAAGGLDSLFVEPLSEECASEAPAAEQLVAQAAGGSGKTRTLMIAAADGATVAVEGRLFSVPWDAEAALVLALLPRAEAERRELLEASMQAAESKIAMLSALVDTTTDGIIVVDRDGRILSASRGAEVLLGYGRDELSGALASLFIGDGRHTALDYLAQLAQGQAPVIADLGCEVIAQARGGSSIPVLLRMNRLPGDAQKFCAVLQDLTARKRIEADLATARTQNEKATSDKLEFLAKVSHEVRTPVNSIIGFSEVMLDERFGPIGNERYRDYLKDIRTSGNHVMSVLSDLLDLCKVEAGMLELDFTSANLNDIVQSAAGQMQPLASRERIIIRMSLAPALPAITVDLRSLRQIIVNLLNHSIRFTGAGGQVIVSTALSDASEVVLRVRDTGIGMSGAEIEAALEPFRQRSIRSPRSDVGEPWGSTATGLGLSLTKALAEANHARFNLLSKVDDGTLVEITFALVPPT